MSKKSRLKKKNKQKLQKRFDQVAPEIEIDDVETDNDEPIDVAPKKAAVTAAESDSIIDAPTRKAISKDVRMIIFTLIGLAIVLIAVKILQQKTGYIDTFGNWLHKITNIQTM